MIKLKRAYESPAPEDGARILVERLWPRGVSKATLELDGWPKEVAPTTELRRWFGHDPAKWPEFRKRYFHELDGEPEAWQPIVDLARSRPVTLIFSSHDTEHNNAVALKEYLEAHLKRKGAGHHRRAA